MRSIKTIALIAGLGILVAFYWLIGSGALGTGDQQLDGTSSGPAGGGRSSPSAVTTGPLGGRATTGQQQAGGNTTGSAQPNSSQAGSKAGADQSASARPPAGPPLLIVNPGALVPENVVTAGGQGFVPGEEVDVTVAIPNGPQGNPGGYGTADKDGNFYGVPITITIGTPIGEYTVTAKGKDSGTEAQATLRVLGGAPYANPSVYSGKGGSEVTFEGGGFRPGEVVSLHFDSLAVDPLEQVYANSEGAIAMTATVPLASTGDHAFVLVGKESNTPLRVPFSVVGFSPWIGPSSYSPRPEERLGFSGHDFAPGEVVRIYRDKVSDNPIAEGRAGKDGELNVPDAYEIPDDAVGKNLFMAVGLHSQAPVSMVVNVLPFEPTLELSVYAGRPGTEVAFKGQGYGREETITAYIGGPQGGRQVSQFKSGSDGTFEGAGAFRIPPDAKEGDMTITAVGERSQKPLEVTFAVLPTTATAGLTEYAGPPGTTLSFEGRDFLPGEMVTIHLGDRQSPVLATVQTDEAGNFQGGGNYTVPDTAKDRITFTLVGETSQVALTATFTVTEGDAGETTPTPEQNGGGQ